MSMSDLSIRELSQKFAEPTPTPGGGSASALSASLAASLVSMVARITSEKRHEQDPDRASFMAEIADEADQLRQELLELADRDSEAYDQVVAAMRMPKETDEDERSRHEAIQAAFKTATEIPHRIAQVCAKVLELAERAVQRGIRAGLSDAATAAELAEASLHSALLTMDINLKSVEDERYRNVYHNKVVHLGKQARERKDAVLAIAEDWIRPE